MTSLCRFDVVYFCVQFTISCFKLAFIEMRLNIILKKVEKVFLISRNIANDYYIKKSISNNNQRLNNLLSYGIFLLVSTKLP